MELTDLKESHDKIKQLNNTLLENMMKEPSDVHALSLRSSIKLESLLMAIYTAKRLSTSKPNSNL